MTTFTAGAGRQTLPLWIFKNLFRPNQAPVVNVVAAVLVLLSIIPIYVASGWPATPPPAAASDARPPAPLQLIKDESSFLDVDQGRIVGRPRAGPTIRP